MLLKVDCLPTAVGKQPSMPLIDSWKKMDVKLMMMMNVKKYYLTCLLKIDTMRII